MEDYYLWLKAIHIIFLIAWMSGMFYLPRLFVYHTEVKVGSDEDKRFQIMERKLLRIIINPSMIITIVTGILLAKIYGFNHLGAWFHFKMFCVLMLLISHMHLAKCRKKFADGKNTHKQIFYRIINEIPTLLMITIVILVIIKPFE